MKLLTRSDDRITYLYIEHATIGREAGALTVTEDRGTVHVPVSALSVLMLGPGTRVTHQAMTVISESGTSVVWVGEEGVRYYAAGRSIARTSRLLEAQAMKVSNTQSRLAVARKMYGMRFRDEDTSRLTMQQLRGKEGARVRKIYRECSELYGVVWSGRQYDPANFSSGDPVNQALSSAHACLYGLCHAVIVALGCSPGLGFIHTGHDRSFVYDIADLYKAEITIPTAFRVIKELEDEGRLAKTNVGSEVRRELRDAFRRSKLQGRVTADLYALLADDKPGQEDLWADVINLWDGRKGAVAGGHNYQGRHRSDRGEEPL
ncbi:type I-E CRISPR-associated endonuclease Cas1e [Corynebacterium heidelbergense]|uniref:type I-E CRISPR-associated endonuclease Cas1e n=1 Tax=Corynebacterium heidelbergense TaxID=2055947 RepID=UPI003082B76F